MARVIDTRKSRLLLAGLVLAHLVVIGHQVDVEEGRSVLEQAVFSTLSPLQRLVSSLVTGVRNAWSGYLDLRGVRAENETLKERLRTAETLLQEKQHKAQEAERLRELLELRRALPMETLLAEAVARDGLPWFRTLTINKGLSDGIVLDAPVISPTGVLGRIVDVGPHAARVQLLLDPESGAGALIERTRVSGVVTGPFADSGTGDLVMKYVATTADVQVGDLVLTSGMDGIYPKGLALGRVRSLGSGAGLFREILVRPTARFDRIEEVLVLKSTPAKPVFTQSLR